MKKAKILVVEDEEDIRELIVLHLKREGYEVDVSADGSEALKKATSEKYDLLILDWMLPGKSGLEITKDTRKHYTHEDLGILMVTAKSTNSDLIIGLESGADDYITKPFELSVLMARVRALLRRTDGQSTQLFSLGPIVIDEAAHRATIEEEEISLTPYEFKLLSTLIQNKGRVLTRDQLISEVQGDGVAVVERAIDTHVFGLRKKLGKYSEAIETVRGVGYRIPAKL
ncbi:MAG: response regulator transcription factor [Oligoflexia bacterium]|nr:response regulator transcription factor [Oligoflexia bacterium]